MLAHRGAYEPWLSQYRMAGASLDHLPSTYEARSVMVYSEIDGQKENM